MAVGDLDDKSLALRAFFLALMSIDRKRQGKPPDPWLEEQWPEMVVEINKRPMPTTISSG